MLDERCQLWEVEEGKLQEFRAWLKSQNHLPKETPDYYLAQFLHSCYHDLEKAKAAINVFFRLKSTTPEFFADRSLNNEGLVKYCKVSQMVVMPEPTPEGYAVVFGRLVDRNPANLVIEDSLKYMFMLVDLVLRERPGCPGIVFLYDLQGYSFRHMIKISLSTVKKYFEYIQDGCPMRHQGCHLFNASSVASHLLTIARPFMYKEHSKMISLYTSSQFENVLKLFGSKCIPGDYGGEAPTLQKLMDETFKLVRKYTPWLKFDDSLKVKENT